MLNAIVHRMAAMRVPQGFTVSARQTGNFRVQLNHVRQTGQFLVWAGACEDVIYDCPQTNYAFRAWHDWHHVAGCLPFEPQAEREAVERQCRDVFEAFGDNAVTREATAMLYADVMAVVDHLTVHGCFPTVQRPLAMAYRLDPVAAMRRKW